MTTSGNPSSYGNPVTFTATVSNGATGNVTFYDTGNSIATAPLNGTTATLTTNTLSVGTHTITASWTGSNTSITSSPVTQSVNKGTPVITWAVPAPVTYGTALSATQLNASTTVPGVFTYSPAAGAVLNVGAQTLSVTFTPTDAASYNTATASATLTVNMATPAITWATPAPIAYGTALSATQFDASSSVPGTFAYSPAAGTILDEGTKTLSVIFTPANTANYNPATASVTLTVTGPSVTVSGPATSILAGTTYSFTATVLGSTNQTLEWAVNGSVGGYPQIGTITTTGIYSAPANANEVVTVSARLQAYPAIQGSAQVQVVGATSSPGQIGFAFSLPTAAATSAGVYNSTGTLLRTLWSNQPYPAGANVASWNGNDDYGNPLAAGSYQIRVLYNNVTYDWGVIGNTSENWLGPNIWDNQSLLPVDMAFIGTTAYVANGYAEGRPQSSFFDLSQPQQPAPLFMINVCDQMEFISTDGNLVYFGNTGDGWVGSSAYVMAYNPATQQYYNFPNGYPAYDCGANALTGVIDYVANAPTNQGILHTNVPTGIAVQAQGNLLAVSHGSNMLPGVSSNSPSQDLIRLFDKRSGALLGSISISDPQRLAFAPDGDLWAISGNSVVLISSVGNKNIVTTTLQGLSAPLAVAVDPSTNNVLVTDGGTSQQVKRFSATGTLLSTYGDLGGYTDCSPSVTKTRLFLDGTAGSGYAAGSGYSTWAFITVLPDSSFWFGDPGNARILHISSQGQYIEQISFLRFLYYIAADHGNPSRVFADTLEYAVDYTQPLLPGDPDPELGGNGSWSLVNNWSVCVPSNYTQQFNSVQTFGNGRTYATIDNLNPNNLAPGGRVWELVELPASGPLRFSGQFLMDSAWIPKSFDHEGNLTSWVYTNSGSNPIQAAYQQNLTGYDVNGWPVWGSSFLLASVPNTQSTDPDGYTGWGMDFFPEATTGGILVTYNTVPSTPGQDHHICGVPLGGTNWTWKASPGALLTTPDEKGTFPDISSFGGHNGIAVLVEGSNIFQGYDGQYGTFSSQWMHWSEDGLLIGQFGHSSSANGDAASNGPLYPGAAGNIATMATVSTGGNIYLYNSDESYHPGIHQWKISGLSSIHELSGSASLGATVTLQ